MSRILYPEPGNTRHSLSSIAVFVAFTVTFALASATASGQDIQQPAGFAQSGATSDRTGVAQSTPALPADEALPGSGQPSATTPELNESGVTQTTPTGTGIVPQNAQSGETPSETIPAEAEPAPAFLEDPAGAISHMLNAERRADLPHDLSPWGMFMAADWVVKGVMIGLAFASLATWTVWLAKSIEIACARGRAKRALGVITSAGTIEAASQTLADRGGPAAFMVRSAEDELCHSGPALDHAGNDGVKERVTWRLARIEAQAGRRLTKGTGVLATIGSTSPFVGLFGTVWGIMNSFIGISEAQTTNLAVVAPGIAEALLATAIGLVAAIPAVIIYNVFARSINGYRQLLADAASGVEQLVSRNLDFRKMPGYDDSAATATLAAE